MPEWVVERPNELSALVQALLEKEGGTIAITTGIYGAGGFGKTTLAKMAAGDERVRRHYQQLIYWVVVGRDVESPVAIAAKVNDVIKLLAGENATFTDPVLAGQHLGSLLEHGPRRLLILDDVWTPAQLGPFAAGGTPCVRLVTTRVPSLLGGARAIKVDQMTEDQAHMVLTAGLPHLDQSTVSALLAATGRWPVLLRLINRTLADYVRAGADMPGLARKLLERLASAGPAVVDEIRGSYQVDVGDPEMRAAAVRATIEASTGLLSQDEVDRFAELAVFAEDEAISLPLITLLWQATGGVDPLRVPVLVSRLADLGLITVASSQTVELHDVIRDFLRHELGEQRLANLHGRLLEAAAATLPTAVPLSTRGRGPRTAWWELKEPSNLPS